MKQMLKFWFAIVQNNYVGKWRDHENPLIQYKFLKRNKKFSYFKIYQHELIFCYIRIQLNICSYRD